MGVIEPLIAWLRKPLRHLLNEFSPYICCVACSRLYTRDAFDIGREAFLHPDVFVLNVWKREMNHLVDQYPVVIELRVCNRTANDHARRGASIPKGLAGANSTPRHGHDQNPSRRHRKLTVVRADNLSTLVYPVQNAFAADPNFPGCKAHHKFRIESFQMLVRQ